MTFGDVFVSLILLFKGLAIFCCALVAGKTWQGVAFLVLMLDTVGGFAVWSYQRAKQIHAEREPFCGDPNCGICRGKDT